MTASVRARNAEQPAPQRVGARPEKLHSIRVRDISLRFALGFLISAAAGAITKAAGARVGGMFLAFPATLIATLTLLEHKDGVAQAISDLRGAIVGSAALIAFAAVVAGLVNTSPALALAAGFGAWVVVGFVLLVLSRGLVHLLGEKQYLPEIPVSDAAEALNVLRSRALTIACAESCTGGIIGGLMSQVPGSADVFRGTLVAYDGHGKSSVLRVPDEVLAGPGAVSPQTAAAMASSARQLLDANVGLGVTGITGQSVEGKPPGLVYLAVVDERGGVHHARLEHDEGPGRNLERAIRRALALIEEAVGQVP